MHDLAKRLKNAREQLTADLQKLVDAKRNEIMDLTSGDPDRLTLTTQATGVKLCDLLASDDYLGRIADGRSDRQRHLAAADLHTCALPLSVKSVVPLLEARPLGVGMFAAGGAALGMMLLVPISRWLLGFDGQVGALVGAPLGAAIAAILAVWLAKSPQLFRFLRWMVACIGIADVALTILQAWNPIARLWTIGGSRQSGFTSLLRRLLVVTGVWLILGLARPTRRFVQKQTAAILDAQIRAWLDHHLDLLIVLVEANRGSEPENSATERDNELDQLLRTIVNLENARRDSAEDPAYANAVVQEFRNAGFERPLFPSNDTDVPRFRSSDEKWNRYFERVGIIDDGDPVRVIEHPLCRHGKVVVRGKITKDRSRTTT